MKKKKIGIIILAIVIIVGMVFATVSINTLIQNIVRSGTVDLETINLQLQDEAGNIGKAISDWEPGDVDLLTWKVKNKGTASVYTRNKLQIYWNEDVPNENQVIYLYPANMTKEEITEDFKNYEHISAIDVQEKEIQINDTTRKIGIEYQFLGDVLDGTETSGDAKEVNYNLQGFTSTTDDNSSVEDDIGFNILFSPETSYLYQGKTITIKVVTEAMQYTQEGKEEWQIVDEQTLN